MKKTLHIYEEEHKKIKLLVQHNNRFKTMADGVQHIIERYEALVRPLRPRPHNELADIPSNNGKEAST